CQRRMLRKRSMIQTLMHRGFGGRRTSRSLRRSTSRIGRPRRVDHFIRGVPPRTRPLERG
ncbi:hypothetical protein PIB30_115134, partial [Stylosanthes scabra]|nr:hypothetical protein [Stylosanthes scabra]